MAGAGFLLRRGKAAGTARMENFRAFDESADFAGEDEPAMEAPPEIGIDERRMHVRAYNYWVSLLDGRPYPSLRDLEIGRAHVCTPVTNAHLVCRILLEEKKKHQNQ